jgi:predicted metal-dependent enzyme (double-stranded beta helix superfamily)
VGFDLQRFVAECRDLVARGEGARALREAMERAVSEPLALASALGDPEHAGVVALYRSPELTILNFTWAPWMTFKPHNHNLWAVIGIFSGGAAPAASTPPPPARSASAPCCRWARTSSTRSSTPSGA